MLFGSVSLLLLFDFACICVVLCVVLVSLVLFVCCCFILVVLGGGEDLMYIYLCLCGFWRYLF